METNFFENTQYKNKFTRKSLLLEIDLDNIIDYTITLPEELKIDNFSEVFVDTVVTNNIEINNGNFVPNDDRKTNDYLGMLLKIDQVNTRTIGGDTGRSNKYNGKFFIPNEASDDGLKIHKGRKQNYLGTIEAGRYRNINITLSNLKGYSIYKRDPLGEEGTPAAANGKFIIELIIIEKE